MNRRRALIGTTGLLTVVLLLTGCGAGFDATASQPYSAADGANASVGALKVLNALVVAPEDSTDGVVIMAVTNRGERADRVVSVTSPAATISLDGPVELPAGGAVSFGTADGPSATASGLTKGPGQIIKLTVQFARAGPITVRTIVQLAAGDYATLTPSPIATP